MTPLWGRIAGLSLVVERYELERLQAGPEFGFERVTTQIRLAGAGEVGIGEDVTAFVSEHDALLAAGAYLDLAGEWSLESFCAHLGTLDQWPEPPEWEMARAWRNWAFESAALDLALRQAGRSLADTLGRSPRPLRFVNSLGLGDPPSVETIARRRQRHPTVGFKLDAEASWTPAIVDELAALGGAATIDFKGRYEIPVEDQDALVAMYGTVLAAFGDTVLLEDPHDLPEVVALLEPHAARLSFDAPVHRATDISTPTINVKPSRIGGLRPLLEIYEHCAAHAVAMYGGGMGELGVGRGQVELLAALFHPDAPNDVAPTAFNMVDPPAGLPASPLVLDGIGPGFRYAA